MADGAGKRYGLLKLIFEHPAEIEAYLADQDRVYEEVKVRYPRPAHKLEPFEGAMEETGAKRR